MNTANAAAPPNTRYVAEELAGPTSSLRTLGGDLFDRIVIGMVQ